MLIEKAKVLVPVIDELVGLSNNGIVSHSESIRSLTNKLEYEDILILQSIMYIGQQEHTPDPKEFSSYDAYEQQLERYRPEIMLKDHMRHLDSYYESGFNRLYSMLAKMPFVDYMQNGLNLLRIRHVIEKAN